MPVCNASRRRVAWRHLRVSVAKRSRIVPLKRSIKAVLSIVPPRERRSKRVARLRLPWVMRRVTSTTRFLTLRLITVPMTSCGQSRKHARPRPAVSFTFSRNARLILLGYGAQPSVHTNTARSACPHLRTCCISRSASWVSRVGLTTPASHKRVETITANVALPHLSSCAACEIRPKLACRIHLRRLCCFHLHSFADACFPFNPSRTLFHQLVGFYRVLYLLI